MGQIITTMRPRTVEFSAKEGDEVFYATFDRETKLLTCRNFSTGVNLVHLDVGNSETAMALFSKFIDEFSYN